MVNAGRVACITTPFIVTIVSLACLISVFLGGAVNKNNTLDELYFAKIDLTNLTSSSSANIAHSATATNLTNLAAALEVAKQEKGLSDYYTIYLRGYCQWNGNDMYANCSSPKFLFDFDIVNIWGLDLNTTGVSLDLLLNTGLKDSLVAYSKVSKAMSVMYLAALATLVLTILVGISAIFSRLGSFFTTFFAAAAALTFIAGSGIALALFAALKVALDKDVGKQYGIETTLGRRVIIVSCFGAALAAAGAVFWLFSVCCCSGRSPYNPGNKDERRTRAEKGYYSYERVGSPYPGQQGDQSVPLRNIGAGAPTAQKDTSTAYEPFRPQHTGA